MTNLLLHPLECDRPYTISEINQGVAERLESANTTIWFSGELSNFKQHSSGHCYLRLKDRDSQIPAVIWRTNATKIGFAIQDGMEVSGTAALRVYQKGGYYQLDIMRLQPAGHGALHAAYEALKAKLEAQGLFARERKRELPRTVTRLGVVTSKTGAALRDIIRVVSQRAPGTDIVFVNVHVQGNTAAAEIAAAIALLNRQQTVDLIIVGRGGGSLEDLWAFNEEVVARAIAGSALPIISAVGHETDFTIADFCADMRAATPSAAAEIAVADTGETARFFNNLAARYLGACLRAIDTARSSFALQTRRPGLRRLLRLLPEYRQSLDGSQTDLEQRLGMFLRLRCERLKAASRQIGALSPLNVLQRGYALVTSEQGAALTDSTQIAPNDQVTITFRRGSAQAQITAVSPPPPHGSAV